jgi:protein-tyrosine phosphatase
VSPAAFGALMAEAGPCADDLVPMSQTVLTLCTGNVCRSPVAEAALRQACPGVTVASAGLQAMTGQGIDSDSAAAARAMGIFVPDHRARQFDAEMGKAADLILVMETHHRHEIARRWPQLLGKTFLLGYFEQGKEIPDPYRRGAALHLHMAELVQDSVRHWAPQILARR